MKGASPQRRDEDERSFESLYRRHRADVYRSLLRELGNREDAEDVTQIAFLDAYRALARGNEPERPRAWLLTIAENARRRRSRALGRRVERADLEREPPAPEADVTVRELRDALVRLPANQRSALVLREIGGFGYAEIADRLELSVAAVQMLLFRARRALRAELEGPSRRRAGTWLPWPVPTWLFGGAGAGVAPRGAGIAAAVGAAALMAGGGGPPAEPAAPVAAAASGQRLEGPRRLEIARPAPARRASRPPARREARRARARPPVARPASPPAARPAPPPGGASAPPRPTVPDTPIPEPPAPAAAPLPAEPVLPAPVPAVPAVREPVQELVPLPPALPLPDLPAPPVPAVPPPAAVVDAVSPDPAPPAGTGDGGGAALPGLPTS